MKELLRETTEFGPCPQWRIPRRWASPLQSTPGQRSFTQRACLIVLQRGNRERH
jgi:hypothetical protein